MSYYDHYGRPSSRPSYPQAGGDSNNGSFGQGFSFHATPTHVPESSILPNTMPASHSSSHSTQQHPPYVQPQYHTFPQQQTQAAYSRATSYHSSSYQEPPPDPRYPSSQANNHFRASPSNLPDPRRLPTSHPLRVGEDRCQPESTQYYSPVDLQTQPATNEMRSPHVYSPEGYPQVQSFTQTQTQTQTQYQGQDVSNCPETAMIAPSFTAQLAPPQTATIEDSFGYAPVQNSAAPPGMGFPRAQTLDAEIAERRRLADYYLNRPGAYVSTIHHMGPGSSGGVIIAVEMAADNACRNWPPSRGPRY
ncbi:hypothetical protein EI94DRAFT_1831218 [Lactarius quietus]|nr:hypothetical protein EI94DRAFT_1831218 [Lactarius quietus]